MNADQDEADWSGMPWAVEKALGGARRALVWGGWASQVIKGQDRSQGMDFFFSGFVPPCQPAWPASMSFVAWLWLSWLVMAAAARPWFCGLPQQFDGFGKE